MRQNNIILLSLTGFNFNDFSELTKFRLSITVVISSLAGYFLAVESVNYLTLLLLSIGELKKSTQSSHFPTFFHGKQAYSDLSVTQPKMALVDLCLVHL